MTVCYSPYNCRKRQTNEIQPSLIWWWRCCLPSQWPSSTWSMAAGLDLSACKGPAQKLKAGGLFIKNFNNILNLPNVFLFLKQSFDYVFRILLSKPLLFFSFKYSDLKWIRILQVKFDCSKPLVFSLYINIQKKFNIFIFTWKTTFPSKDNVIVLSPTREKKAV